MSNTRIVIVGGVAAGATAAARARRLDESASITVIERGHYVSFANCGMPYFISRDIEKRSRLLLQTPEGFLGRYGVTVLIQTDALQIDRKSKHIRIRDASGERDLPYDKLILAQGGNAILPNIPGADAEHCFKLWTLPDMDRIHTFIEKERPKTAIIVGGGFIGLEMAEALVARGLQTTVVEALPQVMATMDVEFAALVQATLEKSGVQVVTGASVSAVDRETRSVTLANGAKLSADMVLFSVGVRPELALAKDAGLRLGDSGGLVVDEQLRTSDPDIFAAGDMVEVIHKVTGRSVRIPLAGPANRQGRIAASNALGLSMRYGGATGTSAVKVFDATAASTGLTEKAARAAGFDTGAVIIRKDHHASYYPGAREIVLKVVYDRATRRLLGAQAFGEEGVDKRIDVLATALQGRLELDDIAELDLAYAPPYSSANDPINIAAFAALHDISGHSPAVTPQTFAAMPRPRNGKNGEPFVLDVRNITEYEASHLKGSVNLPLDELRERIDEVPRDKPIYVLCATGYRSYLGLRILKGRGFSNVFNISGGWATLKIFAGRSGSIPGAAPGAIKPEIQSELQIQSAIEEVRA